MRSLFAIALATAFAALGCAASHHPTTPASLGRPAASGEMLALASEPGPIRLEKIVAAEWAVDLAGLVNLDHPKARAAGLESGDEPIALYLYVLRHPRFGTWLVDSGIEAGLADGSSENIGALVRMAMQTEKLRVQRSTADWLAGSGGDLEGVFLTHIHLDHILGLPDIPADTPVFTGPGETRASQLLHLFSRGTTDRLLGERAPLREWHFQPDPDGRLAGVIDVFGDGSLWALHVPGHSPGSTAYLVRTPSGPELIAGDASHTAWGWENHVEPGTFSLDGPRSVESLESLLALADAVPGLRVHLGHQELGQTPQIVSAR